MPNHLIHTTSPYLHQHAHQPINWYPWGKEALDRARQEDKPLLVSIGYAACHWCHVMAQETFEDEAVGALMNEHFVCIKVDREERPDVDRVYVKALQAMGLRAGWPLHVFLLPDQTPFYGGTYFHTQGWRELLVQVAKAFREHRAALTTSAAQFTQALMEQEKVHGAVGLPPERFTQATITQYFRQLYPLLDTAQGGLRGAPKFPMPSGGAFLLHYYSLTKDERALAQLNLTLEQMAYGGIYDQIGGGFARYATDEAWHLPHFEKMLCDNGLLLSLYAQAYALTKRPLYKRIVEETVTFVTRELADATGGFYCALDADTDGIEGKFYTWTPLAIRQTLGPVEPLLMQYFGLELMEDGKAGVLYRKLAKEPVGEARIIIERSLDRLSAARSHRQRPIRDDKLIASWNGMVLQGLVDAYNGLGDKHCLVLAGFNANFIAKWLLQGGRLLHSYSRGEAGPFGYLEDYAWVVRAFISLYQASFKERWLHTAAALVQYTLKHFYNEQTGLFYFVEEREANLIVRQQEIDDSAIPSANAVMAHNLWALGALLGKKSYTATAMRMLERVPLHIPREPAHLCSWASIYMLQLKPTPVVAIVGPECTAWALALQQHCPRGTLFVGTEEESTLPLLAGKKVIDEKTTIYVCRQGGCQPPVHSVEEALKQLV